MKKALALLVGCAIIAGCGDGRLINDTWHGTYGFANQNTDKDPKVCYKLIVGNLVWSVLLASTIAAPIYFVGWSLFEPAPDNSYCTNKFEEK